MANVSIIPFEVDHIVLNDIRAMESKFLNLCGNSKEALENLKDLKGSVSVFIDGDHVCSGGVFLLWNGVGEIWQIPSVHIHRHVKSYCFAIRGIVNGFIRDFNLHRTQSVVLDDSLHNRWMTYLGFQKEFVMRKYGVNQEDYVMYSKVRG